MNVGIIIKKDERTVMRRLRESLESLGHEVRYFSGIHIKVSNPDVSVFSDMDIIYYWSGLGLISQTCLATMINDSLKIPFVNKSVWKNPLMRDKIFQIFTARDSGIKIPKTLIGNMLSFEEIQKELGIPFVGKISSNSSQGRGVCLINCLEDLEKFALDFSQREMLFQEFVDYDADFRVNVIGGRAVCAFEKALSDSDFRANIKVPGIKISDSSLIKKLFLLAEKITKEFEGADNVGVDFIRDKKSGEIYFLEINSTPWLEDKKDVGYDTAMELAIFLADLAKNKN